MVERCLVCKGTENWCKCVWFAKPKSDPVNNPSHYTSDPSGVECIQVTQHRNFTIGNAIKYLWRAGLKDGNSNTQDLRKAIWYIECEIKRLESLNGPE